MISSSQTTATVAENTPATTTVADFDATDVDANTTLRWSREDVDDGGLFAINASTGVLTLLNAPDFETPADAGANNVYNVTVKVTDDGTPAMSATRSLAVTVTNVNEAPTIDSGSNDFAVDENTATTTVIETYEASDVDAGTNLRWTREGNDAGDFTITENADGDGELRFANVPDHESAADADLNNEYQVTVKVSDGSLSATLNVTVNVRNVNEAPVISGDGTPRFAEIEFDVADAGLAATDYEVGAYTATDQENQGITWSLDETDPDGDQQYLDIDPTSGVLSFAVRPDFENPDDDGSNNAYEITVQATDDDVGNPQTGTYRVTVTVTNADETPEIIEGSDAPSFAEIEYDATGADLRVETYIARDEEMEPVTWSRSGPDAAHFTIDSGTGVLSFAQRPDFDVPGDTPGAGQTTGDNVYEIVVTATDGTVSPNSAANTREYPVAVTVTNVDETPEVTGPGTSGTYAEIEYDSGSALSDIDAVATFSARDEEGQNITWDLSGVDAGDFTITENADGDGVVRFASLPDHDNPADDDSLNDYEFTVEATDTGSPSNTGSWDYVVEVTDINEQPEFTGTPRTAVSYDENTTVDVADYAARDEEGSVEWSLTGDDSSDFSIDIHGVVTFDNSPDWDDPDDSDSDNVYEFTVVATDVESTSSRRSARVAVAVTVQDLEEPGVIEVSNPNPGVGDRIEFTLTDPDGGIQLDQGGDIVWDFQTRTPGGAWQSVPSGTPLSTTTQFTALEDHTGLQVRAVVDYIDRRGPGKSAESEATAAVSADSIINAPPRFLGGTPTSVPEGEAGRSFGDPLEATDRDNDTLTFAIEGSGDSARFAIDPATGQLRTAQALDFETAGGRLLFTASVHDGRDADGNAETDPEVDATRSIILFVTDVEEEGVVTLSNDEPGIGTTVQASLSDGDGSISGQSWQWARSENGRSPWTNISGETSTSYTTSLIDADFFLRATVTYSDNRGSDKSANAVTAQKVFGENQRPTFPSSEGRPAHGGGEHALGRRHRRSRHRPGSRERPPHLLAERYRRGSLRRRRRHRPAAYEGRPGLRDQVQLQPHDRGARRARQQRQPVQRRGRHAERHGHARQRRGTGHGHPQQRHREHPGPGRGDRRTDRRRHRIHHLLAVVPLAQRPHQLGQHRQRHLRHVHPHVGSGRGQLPARHRDLQRRPWAEQDRPGGITARRRCAAGQLRAGVPHRRGRSPRDSGGRARRRPRRRSRRRQRRELRRSHLLAERDGRGVLRDRRQQRAAAAGAERGARLRGQAQLPRDRLCE